MRKTILGVLALIAVSGVTYFIWGGDVFQNSNREITQNEDGTSTYVDNEYNFSFVFPSSWRVDISPAGTFYLYNYQEMQVSGEDGFERGKNKIQVHIPQNDPSVYLDANMEIAGQRAEKGQDAYGLSYRVAIPSHPGEYLSIAMYGDPANYSVLESLMQSLYFF